VCARFSRAHAQTEKGDIVDPYVRVEVRGAPCDERAWKTDVVDNNGFHPVWNASKEVQCLFASVCELQTIYLFD
jgi:hypothetical protein